MKNNFLKRLILFISIITIGLVLTGCINTSDKVKLPNLEGMSRAEIKTEMDKLGLDYVFYFEKRMYQDDSEFDQFVSYEHYKAGNYVDKNEQIYIYTTALSFTYRISDKVTLDVEYENKNFIKDGIGRVTLARTIDGDTAHFYCDGVYIKVRFLGIDTPESTLKKQAWGKAASDYTKNILQNAKEIVLESEGARMDVYDRYLAFVWADGVLLNLQLVENAYTTASMSSNKKYGSIFLEAAVQASKTGRRIYGEIDPEYDYVNKRFK